MTGTIGSIILAIVGLIAVAGWALPGTIAAGPLLPLTLGVVILIVLGLLIARARAEASLRKRIEKVLNSAAQGLLEPRITEIPPADPLSAIALQTNALLDQVEAVFRESLNVVTRIGGGDFDRQPQVAGLRGIYPEVLGKIGVAQSRLSRTVDKVRMVMTEMAAGNFSSNIAIDDESGHFQSILNDARDATAALDVVISQLVDVMEAVTQGSLLGRVHVDARGSLDKLKSDVNRSLESLSAALNGVSANTQRVAGAASETSAAIGQLADGAQSQTQFIGQVVTAVRQTSDAVAEISANTETASRQAREAATVVTDGRAKMVMLVEVVNSIASSSEKINKITDVIEKIANKTNLLSLNAAIEAARAGEHGKGFAVVASEVGKLAATTADSTQEISALIRQAAAETARAVVAVQEVNSDMERIVRSSNQTDAMLQRVSAAVDEQTRTMQEINVSMANLDKIAQSNAAASEEIAASMIELSKVATSTRREVERFKTA